MVDWYGTMCMRLRDYSDGDVWSDGEMILCKTKEDADTTGYFDTGEDARRGEEDRYTGWYYVDC